MKLCLALLLWPASAWAQLSVTAQVNKTQVALDDQVVLAVTVTGPQASLPDPRIPVLQNFSIYSSGRNQSISFVNGRVSSSVTHTFVLVPRAAGQGLIPPITVSQQGDSARTEPIEILVADGAAPAPRPRDDGGAPPTARRPANAPDLFLTAELDKKSAFVNEQATLSVKFHTAVSLLGNPEYVAPKIEGFLTEDLPPLRHYNAEIGGRLYYVTEIKTALFPLRTGRLSIGAGSIRAQVREEAAGDPFSADFFDRFLSQGLAAARARTLSSRPLTLEVHPLPESGKPPDFSGAVGRFSLAANLDKQRGKVGEPVTLSVTIKGEGGLSAIRDPVWPALPSWRAFDPVASVSQEKTGDLVRGTRVVRIVLVPRVSGELAVPPLTLSFF
ncbi:MAG: BatD family protein, partial [Elusimicrobia bacterium]|nr:BatD family protein [Elusimicrobiota bacterium]